MDSELFPGAHVTPLSEVKRKRNSRQYSWRLDTTRRVQYHLQTATVQPHFPQFLVQVLADERQQRFSWPQILGRDSAPAYLVLMTCWLQRTGQQTAHKPEV